MFLIQDTFCTSTFVPFFNVGWKGKIYHASTDSCHRGGVSIIFSKNVNFTLINQHRSEDRRKLILNGSIDDNNVTLVCLYTPKKMPERQHFFNGENNWIKKNMMFEDAIIISGDLNCCLR